MKEGKKNGKRKKTDGINSKMVDLKPIILIITLKINGLNILVIRQCQKIFKIKNQQYETYFKYKYINKCKSKLMENKTMQTLILRKNYISNFQFYLIGHVFKVVYKRWPNPMYKVHIRIFF